MQEISDATAWAAGVPTELGSVVRPGDAGWDAARQAFNLAIDQQPAMVAFPASAEEVGRIVRHAREHGMRVAPQRTGHNAAPLASLEDTILVKTEQLGGVEIDAEARRVRVGAGAQWQDVVPAASELGLAALHGSAPDIGIAGYSLGGGVGWYARKLGLAANSITAVELVTGDGELVRADAEHRPELFWALRGGGGNFGVLTALELELFPISGIFAGAAFFPYERASEVLHTWREWTQTLPDEVTSVGRLLQFPPLEQIPEPMRGRSFALVEAVCMCDEAEGTDLIRPLRELGPEMDTFAMVPPAALPDLHMDPPEPVPFLGRDQMLGELSPEAIDAFVAVAGPDSGSPLISAEIRHLGGALSRPEPGHGALAALDGEFLFYGVGMAMDPAGVAALEAHLSLVDGALRPYAGGRRYQNFTDQPVEASKFFAPDTLDRLRRVRDEVDPAGVFVANHPLG